MKEIKAYTLVSVESTFVTYESYVEIQVGDVVAMRSDVKYPAHSAFRTCIVEKIVDDNVYLARPLMRMDGTGSAWLHAERFSVSKDSLMHNFLVLCYRGNS